MPAFAPLGQRTLARQELHCCHSLTGGLSAYALNVLELVETCLAQCVEVTAKLAQYVLGYIHCAVLRGSAAYKDGVK